ncbi:MAG: hypothetical protein ACUVQY_00360 [Thermoproteota archaeon]
MRIMVLKRIQIFLLTFSFLSYSVSVYSKPTWFEPGVYVEYRIMDASAYNLVLTFPLDWLESFGLLHKYSVGNHTLITDLEPDEFEQWLEEQNATEFSKKGGERLFISSPKTYYT